ncbi:MAG: ECF transporter S component [Firmicutes bacterium]|nr:ECF transporter S component [Bacillota bacterium]
MENLNEKNNTANEDLVPTAEIVSEETTAIPKSSAKENLNKSRTKRITVIGMLCALAYIMVVVTAGLPKMSGFLSYEPKDVIIAFGGFIYGPLSAVIISVIVSFIEMFTVSTTGWWGLLMNIISSCSFIVPASIIYKRKRDIWGAVIGLSVGVVLMTGVMLLWNYLIVPIYMKVPREVVAGMLATVFLPFNLLKGSLNASLAILLYKPLTKALRGADLLPELALNAPTLRNKTINLIVIISTAFVAVLSILFFALIIAKVI